MPSAIHSPVVDFMGDLSREYPIDVLINSDPALARDVQDRIEQMMIVCRYDAHEIFGIKLAIEEAVVNAMKHGNQMDFTKRVRIACEVRPERIDVYVNDEGPGFDPLDVPDPTAPENIERPCGRGVMLMRHYMTDVAFNDRGNAVAMSKVRNGSK